MAARVNRAGRAAAQDREAAKIRRQKIFVAVGGVALLGLIGFQLPLFGSSSDSGSKSAAPSAGVAVPISTHSGAGSGSDAPSALVPRSIARLAARDLFVPQVSAASGGGAAVASAVTLKGPAVRARHFVAKDLFIPQIAAPAASPSTSSTVESTGGAGPSPGTTAGAGYIVVVASIPGIGVQSQKAAARALVAAKNAGLKDVVANDSVPGQSGAAPHFTVYTGPYPTEATAQTELVRALRNGYPHARVQQLPTSSGKGF